MTNVLKSRKGVTLVELLAVVVILGIIAAIAVPTIGGLISRQQTNADKATYTQIVEAARLYSVDENDEQFTVSELFASEFIDVKDNTFGTAADTDTLTLIIVVSNNEVKFYTAYTNATTNTPAPALYVNGTKVLG